MELTEQFLSTSKAAHILGYTVQHTRLLMRQGRLRAEKFGRDWMVVGESVAQYQTLLAFSRLPAPPKASPTIVNVASVPMRSPFRYPGGKTWLVPRIREWLVSVGTPDLELVEPFGGGGIVTLTAVLENLVSRATLVELDEDVAAVWQTALSEDARWLAHRIATFELSRPNIELALEEAPRSVKHRAFATILRNRINRGGILAPGAGVVKNGENGRGLLSRWYPETLRRRILAIESVRDRIRFVHGDGLDTVTETAQRRPIAFFVDPPYTVAGRRLYTHSDVDHNKLFALMADVAGDFLMTYDDAPEVRALAHRHGFACCRVPMKSTHHEKKWELLVSRDLGWLGV